MIFLLYLELHTSDRCDLYTILKLRDRSTFGMKTLKSSSVAFLVKSRNIEVQFQDRKLKQGIDQSSYFGYFVVHRAPNWMIFYALEES